MVLNVVFEIEVTYQNDQIVRYECSTCSQVASLQSHDHHVVLCNGQCRI